VPSTAAERLLVISVDGLAPRAISPSTMPNLCALARAGGACFTATTIVPPITVPAHASMFRGVAADVHRLVDNTPLAPAGGSTSFLAAARAAGRSTASVLCWLPLDGLIEHDAVDHRIAFDAGYDPDDDVTVTAGVRQLLDEQSPDVTLAYLVATDLAGHAHGWDSLEYVDAARLVDDRLAELFAAAGNESAILVTTDHGGVGRNHGEPLADTMQTFVVIRSNRVQAGSFWGDASILDIAPTVADLAGAEPDPQWVGASLLGRQQPMVDHLIELVGSMATRSYGERVDMLTHSLQAAAGAADDRADEHIVLAALLHDIGHLLGEPGEWGLPDHAAAGARFLQQWLPAEVADPIRLHVDAKRYLVATDPAYADRLSRASIETLRQQGGPFDAQQVAAFAALPSAEAAITLRRYDDAGKRTNAVGVPGLESYRQLLERALAGRLD
jgi:predicted HD phosphohydrolase